MALKRKPHIRRITAALGLRRRSKTKELYLTTVQTDDLRLLLDERQELASVVVLASRYWPPGHFRMQELEDAAKGLTVGKQRQR